MIFGLFFHQDVAMQGTQKMQFIIMIELSKVIDPWLAIQWQERDVCGLYPQSALVRLRDFCVCVLTSQPSTELCQFCTIEFYLSF